jgi:hypothetical protein
VINYEKGRAILEVYYFKNTIYKTKIMEKGERGISMLLYAPYSR